MTAERRSAAALDEFHRSMRAAVDTRSKHDLEHAAVMLSVLRAELFATDVGRAQYSELEAQYDDAAQQLSDSE